RAVGAAQPGQGPGGTIWRGGLGRQGRGRGWGLAVHTNSPTPRLPSRTGPLSFTASEGRYRLDGMPVGKGNMLLARNPADQPYLRAIGEVDTSEGDGPAPLDLKLKRGLWAEGQVTDAATGRPLAADIAYYCLESNPRGSEAPSFVGAITHAFYHTDAAGR